MKSPNSLKLAFLITVLLFSAVEATSQLCTPNPIYTAGGVYPDTTTNLTTGCNGAFYQQDFTIVVPPDTTVFGFTFIFNYMTIDSVGGLPPGINFSCNPVPCIFPGATSGCFQLYGFPGASGLFNLTFYVHGQVFHPFFGTLTINYQFPGYKLKIGDFPTITTYNTSATCNGTNGMAWATATGSTGFYTYSWNTSPVSNNDTISYLVAGIYQITVSDTFSCSTTDTVIVNDFGAPIITSINSTNNLCYNDSSGTAAVVVSGGTPGYAYSWSQGGTNASINNLAAGTYNIQVTDTNGCLVSSFVTISEPSQLLAFPGHTDASCFGVNDGSAFVSVIGGTLSYNYNWSSGDTTATVNGLSAGPYSITVTDNNACTASGTTTIIQPPALILSLSSVNVNCFGSNNGSVNVLAFGGSPGYSYLWSNNDTTATSTNLLAGMYQVIVTDTNGCIVLDSIQVGTPAALSISLTGTDETMFGNLDGTVSSSVSGGSPGYSYVWSNSSTSANLVNLAGGTYIVTVTDTNGCSAVDTITIQTLPGFGLEATEPIVKLYPNPSSGFIVLEINENFNFQLVDVYGSIILNKFLNGGKQMIDLSGLSKGIYFVQIWTNNKRKTLKLQLQ